MNKNLIIAILVIIIIAVVGVSVFGSGFGSGKTNTQINFLNENTLKNGDQIQIELKDAQGNAIANEIVNFTYQANGQDEKYSVVTNAEGKAYLTLSNEDAGDHQVTASYGGSDKYNPCSVTQTITISEGESTSGPTDTNSTASTIAYDNSSSSSGSSSSQYYYDSNTGNTYDSNGVIVNGQNKGMNINEEKNIQPGIDENGSLY